MKDEALKLALEALERMARLTGARWALEQGYAGHLEAITAIKQALIVATPLVHEPVAWRYDLKHAGSFAGVSREYSPVKLSIGENWTPLYTTPPNVATQLVQEPHKGLSDHVAQATNRRVYVDPVTGDVGIGVPAAQPAPSQYGSPELQAMIVARAIDKDRAAQPAPVQEPVVGCTHPNLGCSSLRDDGSPSRWGCVICGIEFLPKTRN